jgi:hypothetical protein
MGTVPRNSRSDSGGGGIVGNCKQLVIAGVETADQGVRLGLGLEFGDGGSCQPFSLGQLALADAVDAPHMPQQQAAVHAVEFLSASQLPRSAASICG